jgi:hypothetical protein
LMLRMNSDDDEGSSLVADDEAHLSCLADCGLHKHHPHTLSGASLSSKSLGPNPWRR